MSLEGRIFENELMRAAMDAARIGLCVIASDGQIVILGGDVAAKLGVEDASALVGQHFRSLLVPGLVLSASAELFSLDAPETSAEARLSRPNGSLTMLLFQACTITHDGRDRFRVLTVIDIANFGTTRNRLFDLRRQLDSLNSAVCVSDATQPDMPILFVNHRFEQMTGYPASFSVGRNCRFLQGRERNQPGIAKLAEAIKRRQACHTVITNFRKDGTPFENELFISPLFDSAGQLTHYLGVQRECSGRTLVAADTVTLPERARA